MTYFASLKRSSAIGIIAALVLGLFSIVPNTFAANILTFQPTPDAEYELYSGEDYEVSVEIENKDLNNELTFSVAEASGNIWLYTEIDSYDFIAANYVSNANPVIDFSWNGMLNGEYVGPGDYRVQVNGINASDEVVNIYHDFTVTEEANVDVTSAPNNWTIGSGDYEIDFTLETAVPACVMLNVEGDTVDYAENLNDGNYTFNWDGKLNNTTVDPGNYDWELNIIDISFCNSEAVVAGAAASGTVTATEATVSPTISNLGVTTDPFSPNNDGVKESTDVSFNLNTEADVTIVIENSQGTEVRELMDAVNLDAGNVSRAWDGESNGGSVVSDGVYTVIVTVENSEGTQTKEVDVEVDAVANPVNTQCAGFTDVSANHPDCEAIEFVKDEGIFTGNPDGSLGLNAPYQRDHSAKTALEAFNLFNENSDYCNDALPFLDSVSNQWSIQYQCRGKNLGMITGYLAGPDTGKFVASRGVNVAEMLALFLRNVDDNMPSGNSSSYGGAVLAGEWYTPYFNYADTHNLLDDNSPSPSDAASRLMAIKLIFRLHNLGQL